MRPKLFLCLLAINGLIAGALLATPAKTQVIPLELWDCCKASAFQSSSGYCCESCCWFVRDCREDEGPSRTRYTCFPVRMSAITSWVERYPNEGPERPRMAPSRPFLASVIFRLAISPGSVLRLPLFLDAVEISNVHSCLVLCPSYNGPCARFGGEKHLFSNAMKDPKP